MDLSEPKDPETEGRLDLVKRGEFSKDDKCCKEVWKVRFNKKAHNDAGKDRSPLRQTKTQSVGGHGRQGKDGPRNDSGQNAATKPSRHTHTDRGTGGRKQRGQSDRHSEKAKRKKLAFSPGAAKPWKTKANRTPPGNRGWLFPGAKPHTLGLGQAQKQNTGGARHRRGGEAPGDRAPEDANRAAAATVGAHQKGAEGTGRGDAKHERDAT